MKEIMTKLEASQHGLIKGGDYLPEGFSTEDEVDTYRFWLMAKMAKPTSEVLTKSHDMCLANLEAKLLAAHPDKKVATKKIKEIINSAYFTIPKSFWDNVEKASQ